MSPVDHSSNTSKIFFYMTSSMGNSGREPAWPWLSTPAKRYRVLTHDGVSSSCGLFTFSGGQVADNNPRHAFYDTNCVQYRLRQFEELPLSARLACPSPTGSSSSKEHLLRVPIPTSPPWYVTFANLDGTLKPDIFPIWPNPPIKHSFPAIYTPSPLPLLHSLRASTRSPWTRTCHHHQQRRFTPNRQNRRREAAINLDRSPRNRRVHTALEPPVLRCSRAIGWTGWRWQLRL